MARQEKKSYDLSEAEQRDLVTLIQQGKSLPEKYRFILFEDKREVELVWNGKTRDVCTTVLPFQTLEHIDEPRAETKTQDSLFDSRGRQMRGWSNKLIHGRNLYFGLEHPKAPFNIGKCLVALHHFWRRQVSHIGRQQQLAVHQFCLLERSLTTIALEEDFSDQAQMTRAFRSSTGLSPSMLRMLS